MSLTRGAKGPKVRDLQESLKRIGLYRSRVDGDFGKKTFTSVREFQQRYFVDGIADQHTLDAIDLAVDAWTDPNTGAAIVVPSGRREVVERYGLIKYKEDPNTHWGKNGWVIVTNDWRDHYLVEVDLPIVGPKLINKNIKSSLVSILERIKARGLDNQIRLFGCYAARHKMHNPNRSLSLHAYAAAVDINWDTNGVGTGEGDIDPGIVECFESAGWVWGGRWRVSDPMHFQAAKGY